MSAQRKKLSDYSKLYSGQPHPELKAIEELKNRINGLLNSSPENAKKAALVIEQWLRQKSK